MSETNETSWVDNIVKSIVVAALVGLGAMQIQQGNEITRLQTKVEGNVTSVELINSKIDLLIRTNKELTEETIKLREQLKYLEKGSR